MSNLTITITLPETTYHLLKRAAELTYRSVDEMLDATINAALSTPLDASPELADELRAMTSYNDEALQAAAESSLSPAHQSRLEQLSHAGGARALTSPESEELTHLLDLHDRAVLRRARAFALLAFRGYAIPENVA